jgi:hypothetical protein
MRNVGVDFEGKVIVQIIIRSGGGERGRDKPLSLVLCLSPRSA